MATQNEVISITYSFVDGAHFFTTDDPKWIGLCSASTDIKAAWDDVSFQLSQLAKVNHGENATFKPAGEFAQFIRDVVSALKAELDRRERASVRPAKIVWQEALAA